MGACWSGSGLKGNLLASSDGGEEAYHARFLEDQVLGEGEFGVVKMVHDIRQKDGEPLACKTLRKGVVFKDNTLYAPLKPQILRGEVEMLRALDGKKYCLKLVAIYETPRTLLMVTEYCGGGEMMEYVAAQKEDLRTEDVSRIAFQLLSAIDHCATHGIIHRDIKPENVMFKNSEAKAELRLIDFGSGTIDSLTANTARTVTSEEAAAEKKDEPLMHTTFAGSAFYISPEMFQGTYTQRTDVWSVGVTLYVLVAGYPADELQKAFNILQTSKTRKLRTLPNLPDNMPDSYYDLLEGCLVYRHKRRPSAGELLQYDFVQFHNQLEREEEEETPGGLSLEDVAAAAAATAVTPPEGSLRAASVSLRGSVVRHNLFLGFKKFERSLTTLLAAVLSKKELELLLKLIRERLDSNAQITSDTASTQSKESLVDAPTMSHEQKLAVIPVRDLKAIIRDDLKNEQVLETMTKIPNASVYEGFAYHVALLRDFSKDPDGELSMSSAGRRSNSSRGRRSMRRMNSSGRLEMRGNSNILTSSNGSLGSTNSTRSGRRASRRSMRPNSVQGGNLFGDRSLTQKPKLERSNSLSN